VELKIILHINEPICHVGCGGLCIMMWASVGQKVQGHFLVPVCPWPHQ